MPTAAVYSVPSKFADFFQAPRIHQVLFKDDGMIPNSPLPLLVYGGLLKLSGRDMARVIENLYNAHGWWNSWRDGVYAYQHYHSSAHEVLGCYSGSAKILFGGESGQVINVKQGDAVVIPAGVGHRNLCSSDDFGVVGGYPPKQVWDMNFGSPAERPKVLDNIKNVPLPATDPFYGSDGPLVNIWAVAA